MSEQRSLTTSTLIGDARVPEDTLQRLKESAKSLAGDVVWAVYQNVALDSANHGHLQFLATGVGCTCKVPPKQYPVDTSAGTGWKYRYVGEVDMAEGLIVPSANQRDR